MASILAALVALFSTILQARGAVHASCITEGPYLQQPTAHSIVIKWRTDQPDSSRVEYSSTSGRYDSYATEGDGQSTTRHRVELENLTPNTRYYYLLKSSACPSQRRRALLSSEAPGGRCTDGYIVQEDPCDVACHQRAGDDGDPKEEDDLALPPRGWSKHCNSSAPADSERGRNLEDLDGSECQTLSFVTWPASGDNGRDMRLWAIGDAGTARAEQVWARDAFEGWNRANPFGGDGSGCDWDLTAALGDNAYSSGTSVEYERRFMEPYHKQLGRVPIAPVLGNHDAYSSTAGPSFVGPYYDFFAEPGTPGAWYALDFGSRAHIVALDTSDSGNLQPGSEQLRWLAADLASAKAREAAWLVAFFHHPPYSKGSHDSDNDGDSGGRMRDVRRHVLPLLEAAGADFILAGHSHSYERTKLLAGHYGYSWALRSPDNAVLQEGTTSFTKDRCPSGGTVYICTGSAGKRDASHWRFHPAVDKTLDAVGTTVLDLKADTATLTFVGTDGRALDRVTVAKDMGACRSG